MEFHSQDQWKSAMMTLPDDVFFDLLRSVFGHIKTPFSKQNLLSDLWAFFSREDIQRNLAAYVDEADAQVIAAVAVLGNPTAEDLERFFAGDEGFSALLLNLEERFIVYRFQEDGDLRLALNPALAPMLKSVAGEVFPSFPLAEDAAPSPAAPETGGDDRIFAALLSFFLEEGSPLGPGGRRRRKIVDTGKRIFPGIDLDAAFRCFLRLGLIRPSGPQGETLDLGDQALGAFRDLGPRDRLVYWAAALVDAGNEAGEDPQLFRGRIRRLAGLISGILGFLKEDRLYPAKTLNRFLFVLEWEEAGPLPPDSKPPDIDVLCGIMAQTGLLRSLPQGYCLPKKPSGQRTSPVLTVDAPLFCLAYPGIDFTDALNLASFAVIWETGAVFRFELTRESCLRGFERGITALEMGELLTRLSENRVEPAVLWTLGDWEKRSKEVALFEGTFLSLSPDRRYLAKTEALSAMIRRELVPGFYWLVPGANAAEALRKAGVEVFLRSPGAGEGDSRCGDDKAGEKISRQIQGGPRLFPLPERKLPALPKLEAGKGPAGRGESSSGPRSSAALQDAETLKARFYQVLAGRSLSASDRKELTARIDRRLVLTESQLSAGSVRAEKLEARGLDYVGKASIARQAISAHSLLEVVWSSPEEGEQRILAFPLNLEKSGGDSILVVEESRVPGDTQAASRAVEDHPPKQRIPLGKISLLRRIKKSIFEA
ncbi:MAG: hypothetical protein LBU19_09240 [Treponema sp.]|jgi:hypothetical protein|nr:hypothetical protein [Treponema sp.]